MSDPALPPVACIMGPTASGKTDLAVALVERLPFEIISVDSVMIYRGMDIGTAKPDAAVRARAPHRLIDIIEPSETYSAARFREDCLAEMEQIRGRGRLPLLVGGTGLYFRALAEGLADLPGADPELRAELSERLAEHGPAGLHAELKRVDPESAARIHPNDPQRLQRALEVYRLTGEPLSAWHARQAETVVPLRRLVLAPPRELLAARIEQRFDAMLAAGFVDEVRALRARGDLHPELPSMRAVGYRQAWQFLDSELDEAAFRERAIAATRQYAKRQLTWFRREPAARWVNPLTEDPLAAARAFFEATAPAVQ